MNLFDKVLGGIAGAKLAAAMRGLVDQYGGVQGIVTLLQQQGLRDTARSWVESGPNLPISPAQVNQIFGSDALRELAARLDTNPQGAAETVAQFLPLAIDRLTPDGVIPQEKNT